MRFNAADARFPIRIPADTPTATTAELLKKFLFSLNSSWSSLETGMPFWRVNCLRLLSSMSILLGGVLWSGADAVDKSSLNLASSIFLVFSVDGRKSCGQKDRTKTKRRFFFWIFKKIFDESLMTSHWEIVKKLSYKFLLFLLNNLNISHSSK